MIYALVGIFLIFFIVALAVANFSGSQLEDTFNKFNRVPAYAKITGGELALKLRFEIFDGEINVVRTQGYLTDAYSSKNKTIILSDSTCENGSVAALSVVAHEFGHAIQDRENSKRFKFIKRLSRITRAIGVLMLPLTIAGLFVCIAFPSVFYVGIILVGLAALILILGILIKISTIPLEKDASKRALQLLKEHNILDDTELQMAKELLKDATLTYIADFLRSILWWTFLTKKSSKIY